MSAFWTDTTVKWTPWLRTVAGMRGDYFAASVGDYQDPRFAPTACPSGIGLRRLLAHGTDRTGPWNSGSKAAVIESPKASIILGPWEKTEFFLNFGEGFHSNDARGTVTTLGPPTAHKSRPVPFLTKSRGAEGGIRTKFIDGLELDDQPLVAEFQLGERVQGDTGNTVFGRPSRRYGVELTNRYTFSDWLRIDANLAVSHARFRGWDVEPKP